MKLTTTIAAATMFLFSAGLCSADTLVITYRSGKTQTVTLDEPSTTINSWQFVGGIASATPQQQSTPQEAPKPANVKTDAKSVDKPDEKKSNVRFKWNAPPIKD